MTTRQLLLVVAATTVLALTLAWMIERTQVRRFMAEFHGWYERELGGGGAAPTE